MSFHLGLQLEVVVGHIRQARVSRVTIGCNYLFDQIFGTECYLIQSGKLEQKAGLIFIAGLL